MSAMSPLRNKGAPALLDAEAWEAPFQLSDDDLYLQVGADRRAGGPPADDREDDR